MQGFIVRLQRVKNEDLIVNILTKKALYSTYRFYGARHSTINLGYKIDFEIERNSTNGMGRLYDVIHLGYGWMREHGRLSLWHKFSSLFYNHLKDSTAPEEFYFDLLDSAAAIWHTQNPKRTAVECYVKLLEYEGRLYKGTKCFFCNKTLTKRVVPIRSYLLAHEQCAPKKSIDTEAFTRLIEKKSALFLDDDEIDELYSVLLEGL